MSTYVKIYYSKTKWKNVLIKDIEFLQKYYDFLNKVSNSIEKEHD